MLFLLSRVAVLTFMAGRGTDLGVQRTYAGLIIHGAVPFRDFVAEYPPLVFVFTVIPALIDPSLRHYFVLFRGLCCAVDCATWIVLLQLSRRRPARGLLYILCTTALGPLLYDRIDIVLGLILVLALRCLYTRRRRLLLFLLGVGIAFKLIPVLLVPAVLAAWWGGRGSGRAAFGRAHSAGGVPPALANSGQTGMSAPPKTGMSAPLKTGILQTVILLSAATVLSLGITVALGGHRLGELVEFHEKRGIQIESVPASIEMLLMQSGVAGSATFEFGSVNLHTEYEPLLIRTGSGLLLLMLVGSVWLGLRVGDNSRTLALLMAAVLCAALLFSKVLSPQYFVFLLPVLLGVRWPANRAAGAGFWLLVLAIYSLTGVIFPWRYGQLLTLRPGGEAMLIVRNEALAVLTVWLWYLAWPSRSPVPLSVRLFDPARL